MDVCPGTAGRPYCTCGQSSRKAICRSESPGVDGGGSSCPRSDALSPPVRQKRSRGADRRATGIHDQGAGNRANGKGMVCSRERRGRGLERTARRLRCSFRGAGPRCGIPRVSQSGFSESAAAIGGRCAVLRQPATERVESRAPRAALHPPARLRLVGTFPRERRSEVAILKPRARRAPRWPTCRLRCSWCRA